MIKPRSVVSWQARPQDEVRELTLGALQADMEQRARKLLRENYPDCPDDSITIRAWYDSDQDVQRLEARAIHLPTEPRSWACGECGGFNNDHGLTCSHILDC